MGVWHVVRVTEKVVVHQDSDCLSWMGGIVCSLPLFHCSINVYCNQKLYTVLHQATCQPGNMPLALVGIREAFNVHSLYNTSRIGGPSNKLSSLMWLVEGA
jgi:hypothetical protein